MKSKTKQKVYFTQFKTNIFVYFIICFILCVILSIGFFIKYLDGNDSFLYYSIIPLIFLLFITIITSIYPLFSKIIIDIQNQLITIVHIKLLFCLNKYLYIKLDDIEYVSIEKNSKINYKSYKENCDVYNLIFKIKKEKKIIGIDSEIDNNSESQNLFEFLRDALPKNISISSDLNTINELYQNNKTNRVMSSSKNEYINININKSQGNTTLDFE
jgi:hypothetical protein